MIKFSLTVLNKLNTISSSQFDNLKLETDCIRVWLSRMEIADGMEYNNQVTIEELENGKWTITEQYEAI